MKSSCEKSSQSIGEQCGRGMNLKKAGHQPILRIKKGATFWIFTLEFDDVTSLENFIYVVYLLAILTF